MNVAYRAIGRPIGTRGFARILRTNHTQTVGLRWLSSSLPNGSVDGVLHTLKHSQDAVALRKSYDELKDAIGSASTPSVTPQKVDFENILQVLSKSGKREDAQYAVDIIARQLPSWEITLTLEDYASLCNNLLEQGHEKIVVELIGDLSKSSRNPFVTTKHFNEFLEKISPVSGFPVLQQLITKAVENSVTCNYATFELLFKTKWNTDSNNQIIPTVEDWSNVVYDNIPNSILVHPQLAQVVEQGYLDLGLPDEAKRVVDTYNRIIQEKSARSFLKTSGRSAADLETIQRDFQIQPTPTHWSIVLRNLLNADLEAGLKLYQDYLDKGNVPSVKLVNPVVQSIWSSGGDPDKALLRSVGLYRQLSAAHPASSKSPDAPNSNFYLLLFRLFLRCPDIPKHQILFREVLDDMKSRGLPTNISPIATIQIISEMQRTGSFTKSLEVYRDLRDQLNESGFIYILKAYCLITFRGDLEVPVITQYFSIINDMRMRKLKIDKTVYTNILSSIGHLARQILRTREPLTRQNEKIHVRLIDTTRRVHDFLTLDASISPDAALWNCLLDAYQRLGCFADCYRVWEMMHLTGRYDSVTITIMLDACGYTGQVRQAQNILMKYIKDGNRLDLKNFNTWLECLCRNSKLRTAVTIACQDMPKLGVHPTVDTISLLSKFARKAGCWPDVSQRLEAALPDVWEEFIRSSHANPIAGGS